MLRQDEADVSNTLTQVFAFCTEYFRRTGLASGIFWWFFGPLTFSPIAARLHPDWSADQGRNLFGSLVGHILFGLLLGVTYAAFNRLWLRLFIYSDPLNRGA